MPSQFRGTFASQKTNRNASKCVQLRCALRGGPTNGKNVRPNVAKYLYYNNKQSFFCVLIRARISSVILDLNLNRNFQGFEEREVTCVSSASGKLVDETHCVVHREKPEARRLCESHKSCKPASTWRTGSWGEVSTRQLYIYAIEIIECNNIFRSLI